LQLIATCRSARTFASLTLKATNRWSFVSVAAEMALSVLAYNLTRAMNIVGTKPLMAAIAA
jgi:hypothetical protein